MGTKSQTIRSSRDLGQVISAARRRRGLSQRQVADSVGVSQPWISEVERGKQRAWIGQVLRLMTFLGIDLICAIRSDSSTPVDSDTTGKHPNIDDLVG